MKHLSGYKGASKAYHIVAHADLHRHVWICPDDTSAKRLHEDVQFFTRLFNKDIQTCFFPKRRSDLHPQWLREDATTHERLACLGCWAQNHTWLFVSLEGLTQIAMDLKDFGQKTFPLMVETECDHEDLIEKLIQSGYQRESRTTETGQFSVRGDIVDIFVPTQEHPYRIEFFGDEIQTIRFFDPDTQRSIAHPDNERLELIDVIPAKEFFYPATTEQIISKVKAKADTLELSPADRFEIQQALSQKQDFAALSKFLPFLQSKPNTMLDNLTSVPMTWIDPFMVDQKKRELVTRIQELEDQHVQKKQLAAPIEDFFPALDDQYDRMQTLAAQSISDFSIHTDDTSVEETKAYDLITSLADELRRQKKSSEPLAPLYQQIKTWRSEGLSLYFVFADKKGATRFQKIMKPHVGSMPIVETFVEQNMNILIGTLLEGFVDRENQRVWITETDLFGPKKHHQKPKTSQGPALDLKKMEVGDWVVHVDFGIGIYKGFTKMAIQGNTQDFVVMEYAKGDKLFLPIYRLNKVHPFISADGKKPKKDTLGGTAWKQSKAKTQKAVEEMASELIELYAKRKVARGFQYCPPDASFADFESRFPFDETRDQLQTLQDIETDLMGDKPMDRLICGDVGFGKTEMALRTAFRVASEGRQVAVLVPTTILCQQHFDTFAKRFEPFPIQVDYVSRFKSSQENKETLERLAQGKLDIIIGTHRLLSKDVSFANLGLLVLDEEHRFGVKHKEKIKQFRSKIDVLTMTATPIPRTLQLSMSGIRDLSLINTPPLDRKAVHTILSSFDEGTIRDAIMREVGRGGQVFFLHNRVESISSMHMYLQKLVPDVRIRVAHGQMDKKTLEETMHDFLQGAFDLLLCTTIIESGIDVPSANTLIINRADTFGLAQLYQLRGRVGRSNKEAYAYLLIPGEDLITPGALKRLKTIKKFTELGAGLQIAMNDLEMRGAGNLLGAKQSGHIAAVGFELYISLLDREVRKLKGERFEKDFEPELKVSMPASIPETYIPDQQERLMLYRRLSSCPDMETLTSLKEEMIDRFGALVPLTENLFELIELKVICKKTGVQTLHISGQHPLIEFSDQAPVNMDALLSLIQKNKNISLTPDQKLQISFDPEVEPYGETKKILNSLMDHGKRDL